MAEGPVFLILFLSFLVSWTALYQYSYYGAPEKNQKGKRKNKNCVGKMWALAPLCSARILIIYYFFPQ